MIRRAIITAMAILFIAAVGMGDTEGDTEIVARYNAGEAGDPIPDPTSPEGGNWKARGPSGTTSAVTNDLFKGRNAWKITDRSEQPKSGRNYYISVTDTQISKADIRGWRLHVRLRMVKDFNDTMSQVVVYDNGTRRWVLFFDLDGRGDLVVTQQHSSGNIPHRLTSSGTGNNAYHDFELVYDPAKKTADFFFNEEPVKKGEGDAGRDSPYTNKEVFFGTGSSYGQGEANWNLVQWEILDLSADTSGPEGPILEGPPDNKIMPQLNNPAYPDGFKWQFGWNPAVDRESGVLQYKIIIRQSDNVITEQIVPTTEYFYESEVMLEDSMLEYWSWQVQAQDGAGNWGEWSQTRYFTVESAYPPVPEILSPKSPVELKRGNKWNFDWTDVTHSNGIKQYEIKIGRPSAKTDEWVVKTNVTESQFIYESIKPIGDKDLKNWKWSVRAQNNAGKWSKKASEIFDVATAPSTPNIIVPQPKEILPQQNNPPGNGFVWVFEWEPSTYKNDIMEYQLIIEDNKGNKLFDRPIGPKSKDFTFTSNDPITGSKGGIVKVRARSVDDNWSDWSSVKFKIAPTVSWIEGVVADTSENVLNNVMITIDGTDISILTDDDGSYTISELKPDDKVNVTFSKEGFLDKKKQITLQLGENFLSVSLGLSASVSGIVKDIGDNIVSGATVTIKGTDESATTDDNGSYTISGLNAETQVNIIFKKDGFCDMEKDLTLKKGEKSLSVKLFPVYNKVQLPGFPKTVYGIDHPEIVFKLYIDTGQEWFPGTHLEAPLWLPFDVKIVGEWKYDSSQQPWQLEITQAFIEDFYCPIGSNPKSALHLEVKTDNRYDYIGFHKRDYTFNFIFSFMGFNIQWVPLQWGLLDKKKPAIGNGVNIISFLFDPGIPPGHIKK